MITVFTLKNSFTCFFLRKFNNFALHENPRGSFRSSRSSPFTCLMVGRTSAQMEVQRKSLVNWVAS